MGVLEWACVLCVCSESEEDEAGVGATAGDESGFESPPSTDESEEDYCPSD